MRATNNPSRASRQIIIFPVAVITIDAVIVAIIVPRCHDRLSKGDFFWRRSSLSGAIGNRDPFIFFGGVERIKRRKTILGVSIKQVGRRAAVPIAWPWLIQGRNIPEIKIVLTCARRRCRRTLMNPTLCFYNRNVFSCR